MSGAFTLFAPAKVNLGLEVVDRRTDGYHTVVTILQAIGLYDRLTFSPAPNMVITVDGRPAAADDLTYRAAMALREASGATLGATIDLAKNIPVAAGLGGGSSDAAATLRGLCRLWGLKPAVGTLGALAASLGADVPFFLRGGAALATGVGNELSPIPSLVGGTFVVLTPPVDVPADKTRSLYQALVPDDFSSGAVTRAQAARLSGGDRLEPQLLRSAFDGPCARLCGDLATWRERLVAAGAPWVALAGSGPSLFTIIDDRATAFAVAARLAGDGARCVAVQPCGVDKGDE